MLLAWSARHLTWVFRRLHTSLQYERTGFAIVRFLDRNYLNNSVATQIPHEPRLAPIPYTNQTFLPHRGLNQYHELKSAYVKHEARNYNFV